VKGTHEGGFWVRGLRQGRIGTAKHMRMIAIRALVVGLPFVENEKDGGHHAGESSKIVPT